MDSKNPDRKVKKRRLNTRRKDSKVPTFDTVIFQEAPEIIVQYLNTIRSFQYSAFQEWFDKYTTENCTFFMMRLQEHSLFPVSVYKEITGRASACQFLYTRMMTVPDGCFDLKIRGIYPIKTDSNALCMIVCDYTCAATKVFETEAIEEEEEGDTDQHQHDLELAVSSLNQMAHFKHQNQMPLDDGVFDEVSDCGLKIAEELIEEAGYACNSFSASCDDFSHDEEQSSHSMASHSLIESSQPISSIIVDSANVTRQNDEEVSSVSDSSVCHRSARIAEENYYCLGAHLTPSAAPLQLPPSHSSLCVPTIQAANSCQPSSATTDSSSLCISSPQQASTSTSSLVAPLSIILYQPVAQTSANQPDKSMVFRRKQIRLVDQIPIFVAKPGAMFRLGNRYPNGGIRFQLHAKIEFYVNKEGKITKLRYLMNS
jgi:hypothetical protein